MIFGFYQSRHGIGHGADTRVYGFLKSNIALECLIRVEQVSVSDTVTTLTLKCLCFIEYTCKHVN